MSEKNPLIFEGYVPTEDLRVWGMPAPVTRLEIYEQAGFVHVVTNKEGDCIPDAVGNARLPIGAIADCGELLSGVSLSPRGHLTCRPGENRSKERACQPGGGCEGARFVLFSEGLPPRHRPKDGSVSLALWLPLSEWEQYAGLQGGY